MPVVKGADGARFQAHGSTFTAYAAPSRGGSTLCAWRLDVPAGTAGAEHRVSHEEVLYVLDGRLHVALDGEPAEVVAGDVVVVPAGSRLRVDTPDAGAATAWVSTTVGIQAELPDGTRMSPPWAA